MKLAVCAIALAISLPAAAQEPPATQPTSPATTPPAGEAVQVPMTTTPTTTKMKTPKEEEEETTAPAEVEPETQWGVGARVRFITIPKFVFHLFVDHSTSMNAWSVAGEVIRRKGNFDIVMTLEYAKTSPKDGLWQEKGEEPNQSAMYPDIVNFNNLAFLSGDVSFIWHTNFGDIVSLRYGAGIGVGVPLGGYKHQDTICDSTTTIDDLDDPNTPHCHRDTAKLNEDDNIPPVLPVVNLLIGMRFKVSDQFSLNVEGGWRFPAFFVGAGAGYYF